MAAQSDTTIMDQWAIGCLVGVSCGRTVANSCSAIVTCDVNNIASRRVIEKAGGEFLNTFYSEQDQYEVRRYRLSAE